MKNTKLSARKLIALSALTAGTLVLAPFAQSATVSQFRSSGTGAYGCFETSAGSGCINAYENVQGQGQNSSGQAYVHFWLYSNSGYTYGYGYVPASAIRSSGNASNMSISFSPDSVAGYTLVGPATGNIDVTVTKGDKYSWDSNGSSRHVNNVDGFRQTNNGQSSQNDAVFSGSLLDTTIGSNQQYWNYIHTSRGMNVTIDR